MSELVIESSERIGDGGFLVLRRYKLRNRRPDGSTSEIYACDFLERSMGLDAVAVAIYRRGEGGVEVLLRSALRPPLALGRDVALPVKEPTRDPRVWEVVAGIIESSDQGLEGVRARAADEVHEEAGYRVEPDSLEPLGAPVMPMPAVLPEQIYLFAVELAAGAEPDEPAGDGSPMEEGAEIVWRPLAEAIAACGAGEITDSKTEIALRRLAERLG